MAIWNRKRKQRADNIDGTDGDQSTKPKKEKGSWRKPANTAFKQQRLKAWQPILTPKTVLPTLFIIGILFAPIGGLLIWGSSLVTEMTFDYTDCWNLTASDGSNLNFTSLPTYSYRLRSSDSGATIDPPTYAYIYDNSSPPDSIHQCVVQFDVVSDLSASVFIYYKLTNFFQNNRKYVSSYNTDQLQGQYVSASTLNGGDCSPLATTSDGMIIYPCGLIANSLFNDTYSNLTYLNDTSSSYTSYNFTQNGISWSGEASKYAATPGYDLSQIVPPPNWALQFPNNYTDDNPPPNLKTNYLFQNWMRISGLPTFTKLYGRNDGDTLLAGRYQITINMNYPVQGFGGTKSFVITTVSWIGGKNPFLGWAYVAAACLFVALAIAGTILHIVKPRRLGDMSLLSWNQ